MLSLVPLSVSHTPLSGDSPGALTLGDPLASDALLQLAQLGPATHVHATLAGSSSTVGHASRSGGRQSAQEGDEAAADGRHRVLVGLVEHLRSPALRFGLSRRLPFAPRRSVSCFARGLPEP
jgi:hypothetical protein